MSSIDFEECCHKLMKINLPAGLEHELPSMIVECCSQERTYSKFYGLIGERFAKINRLWSDLFEAAFAKYYDTIHRYETNRLRNIAQFFGHLISNDAIGWHVLSVIHLNEEETTSSSRIFIKILFQNLAENLGLPGLQARFRDEILRPSFEGLFPTENPRHTRFSVNYFTSIGMGVLTEDMREQLKNAPRPTVPALPARASRSLSRTTSDRSRSMCSTCTGSPHSRRSRSPSYSRSPSRGRSRSYTRSLTHSRSRSRSYTPSRSRTPIRRRRAASDSRSRSPAGRSRSRSVSRTPAKRRGRSPSDDSRSPSRSRSPYRRRSVSRSVTPARRSQSPLRNRSYTRSISRSPTPPRRQPSSRPAKQSLSPPPRRRNASLSRSPTPKCRDQSRGRSYSRTPPRHR